MNKFDICSLIEIAAGGSGEDAIRERRIMKAGAYAGDTNEARSLRTKAAHKILKYVSGYAQQLAMVQSIATNKLSVVKAPRRSGKTGGIGSLIEMRVINRDNYVVRVITERLSTPSINWLESTDKPSFMKRLKESGLLKYAKIDRGPGCIKKITFAWGSEISIHHMAHQNAVDDAHGFSGDLYWCDEAQNVDLIPLILTQVSYTHTRR